MIKGTISFNPNNKLFKEHFPGNPIVPGSLIINEFYKVALKHKLNIKQPFEITNFKFKGFLKPGKYQYVLEKKNKGVWCTLFDNSTQCTSGWIL